jgi:endoribonuclease Dicer
MGSAGNSSGDLGMTLTEQKLTIKRFRNGELNCLFATSAGEEGIDIPDCNVVIRFDLYKTVIQYIQSRGRARRVDSKFYQMVETGNYIHQQIVDEVQDHEVKMRKFCSMLPEDRLITGCDYDIDYHLAKERSHRIYKVPSTGALLTYKSSIAVLANFVSSLPHPADVPCLTADYIVHNIGGEFECEVLLPDSSPIKSAIGRRASTKQIAKCSAAFDMCIKLKEKRYLDDNLRSAFTKRLPAMRNARLAINSKKRAEYPMKMKPNAWSVLGFPEKLFVTVIRLSSPEAVGRRSRPLSFLTREPLPRLPTFPIYFGDNKTSEVEFVHFTDGIHCRPDDVDGLTHFTLRIFRDVFSKEYAPAPEKMPYFFAPLLFPHGSERLVREDSRKIIDWACIQSIRNTPGDVEWENQPEHVFDNKFVRDPFDGSRKFYTVRRRPDLRSTDAQLPGLPKGQYHKKLKREEASYDIWSSTITLYGNSRAKITRREDLSVVEAEYIPLRRNLLDRFTIADDIQPRCFLVFQTLKLSVVSFFSPGYLYESLTT